MIAIIAAIAAASVETQPINKLVTFRESVDYYDVSGRSIRELREQMFEKGPTDGPAGGETLAMASTGFRFEMQFVEAPEGRCGAEEVSLDMEVIFEMPRWLEYEKASRKMRSEWDKVLESLWIHERGHAEISRRAANLLYPELLKIPPAASCDALVDVFKAVTAQFEKDVHSPAQRKYDQKQHNEAPTE